MLAAVVKGIVSNRIVTRASERTNGGARRQDPRLRQATGHPPTRVEVGRTMLIARVAPSSFAFAVRNTGLNYCICKHATTSLPSQPSLEPSRGKHRFYSNRNVETRRKSTRDKMRNNYAKMLEKCKCEYVCGYALFFSPHILALHAGFCVNLKSGTSWSD